MYARSYTPVQAWIMAMREFPPPTADPDGSAARIARTDNEAKMLRVQMARDRLEAGEAELPTGSLDRMQVFALLATLAAEKPACTMMDEFEWVRRSLLLPVDYLDPETIPSAAALGWLKNLQDDEKARSDFWRIAGKIVLQTLQTQAGVPLERDPTSSEAGGNGEAATTDDGVARLNDLLGNRGSTNA
jgi:hypothetical protein